MRCHHTICSLEAGEEHLRSVAARRKAHPRIAVGFISHETRVAVSVSRCVTRCSLVHQFSKRVSSCFTAAAATFVFCRASLCHIGAPSSCRTSCFIFYYLQPLVHSGRLESPEDVYSISQSSVVMSQSALQFLPKSDASKFNSSL